jgi:RNA recognition motif-containing protein
MAKELYVGHISENAHEEDIRKLFSVMGTVTSVHLIIDPDTGEFKRCGYVRMAADVDLNEVVETLDGAYLVDQVITVSIARPQKPGMSKSGKPGKFGGPRRPAFGGKAGAAPRGGAGPKSPAEPKARPERKAAEGRKPRSGAKPAEGAKGDAGRTPRAGQGGRGQKPAGRPAREGSRGSAPKPRRP